MRIRACVFSGLLFVSCLTSAPAPAQNFRHAGVEFEARREVSLQGGSNPSVAVCEFYHHGLIQGDGANFAVIESRGGKPVPARVLQLGPGDFCRIAFQPEENRTEYELFYGGPAPQPEAIPKWTSTAGLLLETRAFRHCNLNQFEAVKEAFEGAEPIGSGYVEGVSHSSNPFAPGKGAFLSRYSGTLHIDQAGEAHFWTASQDASFLLIDGKVVVAAPGRHQPLRQARPDASGKVDLAAGTHSFEYYHAAAGPEAMMVAAWQRGALGDKPKPTAIEGAVFRTQSVATVEAGPPLLVGRRPIPDFGFRVVGDCPLPEQPEPLVGVTFENRTPPALALKAKILWSFGDGQTSEEAAPAHVYLKPGLYTVTLSITRGSRTLETTNRIEVARPDHLDRHRKEAQTKQHKIDDYLPVLDQYDPAALPIAHLSQLVAAYLWKAETVASPDDAPKEANDTGNEEEEDVEAAEARLMQAMAERRAAAIPFVRKGVDVAKSAFVAGDRTKAEDPKALYALAVETAVLSRERLGDSKTAYEVLRGAASLLVDDPSAAADCAVRAADIAINDLLAHDDAKALLDAVPRADASSETDSTGTRLRRVWGDYYAAQGKTDEARKAYQEAAGFGKEPRQQTEAVAWSGAYGRSTEQYLQTGQWDRAMRELQAWQDEFPLEKLDGYWHSKFIRYWIGREKYDQAVAQVEQLLAVNPSSAYADQVLWLGAQSEYRRGRKDRAEATLHSLIKDYPGSPLVPEAEAAIESLRQGEWDVPKTGF